MSLTDRIWGARPAPFVFDVVALPSRHAAQMVVAELRDLPRGSTVLDVGIGTALIASRVERDLGFQVDGVDPSQVMLDKAAGRMRNAKLLLGDATSLPVNLRTYDALISNHVFKYVRLADLGKVVSEISVATKASATVIISDLNLPRLRPPGRPAEGSLDEKVIGIWSAGRDPLIDAMDAEGFELTRTRYPLMSFLLVFRR